MSPTCLFCVENTILEKFDSGIWVEDNPKHAHHGLHAGQHKTYLLNKPWNKSEKVDEEIIRIDNWSQLIQNHFE